MKIYWNFGKESLYFIFFSKEIKGVEIIELDFGKIKRVKFVGKYN